MHDKVQTINQNMNACSYKLIHVFLQLHINCSTILYGIKSYVYVNWPIHITAPVEKK